MYDDAHPRPPIPYANSWRRERGGGASLADGMAGARARGEGRSHRLSSGQFRYVCARYTYHFTSFFVSSHFSRTLPTPSSQQILRRPTPGASYNSSVLAASIA